MLPPGAASLDEAYAAVELWEFYKRRRLDPTQRLTVEIMMATDADGRWAATTTGREMPRQNGKGDEIEVVELWGLVQRAERILHTVHDAVLLATETQSRLLSVIDGHPDLRRLKQRAWRGTGQQMIEMRNGGIIWYRTRTGGGARGVDEVDRVVVDEAQHAEEEHLAAITPTQLVSQNPQLNALGTSGIAGKSAWWWRTRIRALGLNPGDFGYVGHTAEAVSLNKDGKVVQLPVDVEDRGLWHSSNPALGRFGGPTEVFLKEQLLRLGPALFAREHLGVWDTQSTGVEFAVLAATAWEACQDVKSGPLEPFGFALDVTPERSAACFAVCARSGKGGWHAEITSDAEGRVDHRPGTAWVVARAVELQRKWGGQLAIGRPSPAWSLEKELLEAGVELLPVETGEHAQACGAIYDAIVERRLHHLGQPDLDIAVAGADRRYYGDSWLWSRRQSAVDISPLVAVTLAAWAHMQAANSDPALSVF